MDQSGHWLVYCPVSRSPAGIVGGNIV